MDFKGIEWRSVDRGYHDQDRARCYRSLKGIIQI